MLTSIFFGIVNAVSLRREFSIVSSRVAFFILLYSGIMCYDSLFVTYLDTGIGVFNGLFHSPATSQSSDLFIYIIAPTILLTAFYARRIVEPIIAYNRFVTGRPTKKWRRSILKRFCESMSKYSKAFPSSISMS